MHRPLVAQTVMAEAWGRDSSLPCHYQKPERRVGVGMVGCYGASVHIPSPCSLVVPVWSHTVSWGPLLSFMLNPMLVFLLLNLLQTALILRIFNLGSVTIWCTIFYCPRGCPEKIWAGSLAPLPPVLLRLKFPETEILTLLSVGLGGVVLCWEPLLCGKAVNAKQVCIEPVHCSPSSLWRTVTLELATVLLPKHYCGCWTSEEEPRVLWDER